MEIADDLKRTGIELTDAAMQRLVAECNNYEETTRHDGQGSAVEVSAGIDWNNRLTLWLMRGNAKCPVRPIRFDNQEYIATQKLSRDVEVFKTLYRRHRENG